MSKVKYRYRLWFSKIGPMRFIGHLDLQSLFQRGFKRAGLPVAYSEGFNPHQLLSFASPLPLGTAGHKEILEVFMASQISPEEILEALNPQMPDGISIVRARQISATGKGAAALAAAATYRIIFPSSDEIAAKIDKILDDVMASSVIEVEKKTKKGRAMADIRPDIHSLAAEIGDVKIWLQAVLATGSSRNLKPNILIDYIFKTGGIIMPDDIVYERLSIILSEEFS